ncbi:mechanosensitive ion channel [Nanohaloarchaea archaeon H01]|nr:mechanosensitive ion channel [Nanohaloarchaea archaeon H01]
MIEQILSGSEVYFQLARFFIVFAAGIFLTRAVFMPLTAKLMTRKGSTKKAKHSIENISGLIGLFSTLLIALQAASFGNLLTILGTIAAAATVAIGFGMRDQVASLVAGVFIQTDNPFVKGDYIKVNDTEGRIKEINLRTTKLNAQNDTKIVPNNILTANTVRNFTRGNRTADSIKVTVKMDKIEKAKEVLGEAVSESEDVLKKPEPEISQTGLEEGKAELEANFWTKDTAGIREIRSRILRNYTDKAAKERLYLEEKED